MGKETQGRNGGTSWKGTGQSGVPRSTHRWQAWRQRARGNSVPRNNDVWILRGYIAAGVVLLSVLTYALLGLLKTKTELIAFAVTEYGLLAPPNAWALEDVSGFDRLSKTFAVTNLSPEWRDRETGLKAWRDSLFQSAKRKRKRNSIVIYISALGLVNDAGQPCLLPPESSPLSPVSFLTIESLLNDITELLPASQQKLLVLDTSQVLVNWEMGLLYNTFNERLQELIEQEQTSNLAVLCSTAPGQRRWASPEMAGTAFGQFFQLGIAGMADGFGGTKRDRTVSLIELENYLREHVDAWAIANRGAPQTPHLVSHRGEDFELATVNPSHKDLWDDWKQIKQPSPAVSSEESAKLWKKMDTLRKHAPLRYAPVRWRELECRLLNVEAFSNAGQGYSTRAKREFDALADELTSLVDASGELATSACFVDHWRIVDKHTGLEGMFGMSANEQPSSAPERILPSIPLNEYFGLIPRTKITEINSLLDDKLTTPLGTQVSIHPREPEAKIESVAWLSSAQEENVLSLWKSPDVLSDVLASRRSLERLGVPRTELGQPGDERTHYFLRESLRPEMAAQRQLEDLLFLGELDSMGDAESLQKAIVLRVESLQRLWQEATQATDASHHAWAQLPYIANWICSPGRSADPNEVKRLVSLIARNGQLGKLSAQTSLPLNSELPFFSTGKVVAFELSGLQKKINSQVARLSDDPGGDPETYQGMSSVLRLPTIPADKRGVLLDLIVDVRRKLQLDYIETADGIGEQTQTQERDFPSNKELDRIASWPRHPLLELVLNSNVEAALDERGGTIWEKMERANQRVRRKFTALRDNNWDGGDDDATGDFVSHRQRLVDKEQELRSVASLLSSFAGSDPIGDLRNFDLKQLLVWHREQVIEGGWHTSWDMSGQAFARVAADDCQRAMRSLRDSGDVLQEEMIGTQLRNQDQTLKSRLAASLDVVGLARPREDGSLQFRINVIQKTPEFSNGRAAVFAEKQRRRLNGLRFANGVAVPVESAAPIVFTSNVTKGAQFGGELNAVVFFRGRRFIQGLTVDPFDGLLVDYQPHRYGPPSVKLSGNVGQRGSFVFILDCSNSMKKEIPLTGERGSKYVRKLDAAKRHLGSMLYKLAPTDTRIGVEFVGHRVGWNENGVRTPRNKNNWPRQFPASLAPSRDVELIKVLRKFDGVDMDEIQKLLKAVKPWGESPLYISLIDAFKLFDQDAHERKGIIAITDGQNQVDAQAPGATILSKRDVLNKAKEVGDVPVHLIDFAGQGNRNNEFVDIAKSTGGSYVSAESGKDLLNAMQEKFEQLDGFYVDGLEPRRSINEIRDGVSVPRQLNDTVRFTESQFNGERYGVRFRRVSKEVKMVGGEALALEVYDDGGALGIRSEKYPISAAKNADLYAGNRSTGLKFSVHPPIRSDKQVDFTVSLQLPQKKAYTPRPTEVWLEITPTDEENSNDSYVFYDVNFEPETPVPELKWTVNDWPEPRNGSEEVGASIRFWCKYSPTPPAVRFTLRELMDTPDRFKEYTPVKGVSGVEVNLSVEEGAERNRVIRVAQKHTTNVGRPGTIYDVRIGFNTTSKVTPSRVRRRFDNKVGIATHEFHFSESDWKVLASNAKNSAIVVSKRTDCLDGALEFKDPLDVPVSSRGDLLRITQ